MKKRYKYSLIFIIAHILLTTYALLFVYEPNVPNSDLNLLAFPNIIIPLIATSILPHRWFIFLGVWRNLYLATIFWLLFGFIIGLVVEKIKNNYQNKA